MWLQRSLSLATIHMLRDGLWSLARTQGLNQEQHTQLQLHIVKTLATDIDASLEELLKFDDDFDQESMRLHFFQYMLGFYGQRCQRSNDGNASIVPLAQFQCSGERLLIATANQALDVTFVEQNKIKLVVEKINKNLTLIEKIKKIIIVNDEFTIDNGMLTPTLKLKRKKIIENYKQQLENLY